MHQQGDYCRMRTKRKALERKPKPSSTPHEKKQNSVKHKLVEKKQNSIKHKLVKEENIIEQNLGSGPINNKT